MNNRLILLALMLALYALAASKVPDGGWDARAIWNVRAKMINGHGFAVAYTGEDDWEHLDYPPLLSLVVAAGWRLGVSAHVVHGLLFAALVWLVSEKRLWAGALVGAAAVSFAASQSADVPIAVLLLAAVVAFQHGRFGLTGLALGLAALTKNEGVLMALAFFLAWTIAARRLPLAGLRGAFVPLALLLAFKLLFPAPTEIVGTGGMFARLLDPSRYGLIAVYIPLATVQWAFGAFLVLTLALWLSRVRLRGSVPLAAVMLTWLGYLAIYVIAPQDPAWHMLNSYDRLLIQVFPAFVLALLAENTNQFLSTFLPSSDLHT